MVQAEGVAPVWSPTVESAERARMSAFRRAAGVRAGREFQATPDLHQWSLDDMPEFWALVWDFFSVVGDRGVTSVRPSVMPDAVFFPDSRINLAENLLAPWADSDDIAVALVREGDGLLSAGDSLSGRELTQRVGSFAMVLRERGVVAGDRIGLILPVGPDALVCTLGALAIGAVVSSVSPEFGAPSIVDRLGQLQPTVLVAAPFYRWSGKAFNRSDNVAEVVRALPSLRVVFLAGEDDGAAARACQGECSVVPLEPALSRDVQPSYERLPFDHPAYVLFSSGTTGKPKCLIHRGGGVLLKHLVELGLHADIQPADRLLFYTTTSWMMWNWQISCLALGATLVLHDGAPTYPSASALFTSAKMTSATHLGLSARLLDHLRAEGIGLDGEAGRALRQVLVTGSPLSPPTAEWLADELGPNVMLNPISGGTDLVGCFVGGDPTRPFFAGEMTGPILGTAVDVYAAATRRADDNEAGELVCLQPFPTVPVGIWGDDTGERLRATYFDMWPGIWVHGDRAVRSSTGGVAILGRSDATLNVGGVRIGTSEIYAALADHPVVADSLAFGQEHDGDTRIVLLVVTSRDAELDEAAKASIKSAIRAACSPRHVPAVIIEVADLPRTQTGKISEIAVREAVHGREVKGIGALANPESLDAIVAAVPTD